MLKRYILIIFVLIGFSSGVRANWNEFNTSVASARADVWSSQKIAAYNQSDLGLRAAYGRLFMTFNAFFNVFENSMKFQEGAFPITDADYPHITACLRMYHESMQEFTQILKGEGANDQGLFNLSHEDLSFYDDERFSAVFPERHLIAGAKDGEFIAPANLVKWANLIHAGIANEGFRSVIVCANPMALTNTAEKPDKQMWINYMQALVKQQNVCLQIAYLFKPQPAQPDSALVRQVVGQILGEDVPKLNELLAATTQALTLGNAEKAQYRLAFEKYAEVCEQIVITMRKMRLYTPDGLVFNDGAISPELIWKALLKAFYTDRTQALCGQKNDFQVAAFNALMQATGFNPTSYLQRMLKAANSAWNHASMLGVITIYDRISLEEVFRFIAKLFKDKDFLTRVEDIWQADTIEKAEKLKIMLADFFAQFKELKVDQ